MALAGELKFEVGRRYRNRGSGYGIRMGTVVSPSARRIPHGFLVPNFARPARPARGPDDTVKLSIPKTTNTSVDPSSIPQ